MDGWLRHTGRLDSIVFGVPWPLLGFENMLVAGASIGRRAALRRFAQNPFSFCLSTEAAKVRRSPREPRRVVQCNFCGAIFVLGNARGDHKTRDASSFYCDAECRSGTESFIAKADPVRIAKRVASRARSRANELKKRQLANVKPCCRCQAPTSRRRFCSDECCRLARNFAARQQKTL